MEKRKLGRTDLDVTSLCLGTMTWGEQNTKAEAYEQLDYAVDQGINFIDAAELYPVPSKAETQGRTEEIIGDWMADRGNRSDIIMATKVIGRSSGTWFRDGGVLGRLNRDQIHEAVNKSLKRLKTDYIDLYQIHWPDRNVTQFGSNPTIYTHPADAEDEVEIAETMAAMQELVDAGKIRHLGLSNESGWGTMNYLREADAGTGPRVVSVQNAYSLLNRTFEVNMAEVAMRENVGLLAYSVLGQGFITGKYLDGKTPEGTRMALFKNFGARYRTIGADPAVRGYMKVAEDFGVDVAQMALAFATSRSFTTSTILGATKMDQLKTDIASQQLVITEEMEKAINDVHMLHSNPCP
ncbi:aldo/keto reductase [Cohaesibacter celericrescens]|uniref:Aldo/keto reductase n=1 Tax=Cohaesibacter celericrescens TaxID=2067669 RepID=A0A2N5XPH2_9HYPH|nr:aldo/keto reductase [Cohaesibacter celericrescens]PLW76327.1 aldo/keto reductase [Cohaesibacter celericrescens]